MAIIDPEWELKKSPFDEAIASAVDFWEWYQQRYDYHDASEEDVDMVDQSLLGIVELSLDKKYRKEPKIAAAISEGARVLALDAVNRSVEPIDKYHVAYETAKSMLWINLNEDTYGALRNELVERQGLDVEHFQALFALAGMAVIATQKTS
jgi:hypothetical protein